MVDNVITVVTYSEGATWETSGGLRSTMILMRGHWLKLRRLWRLLKMMLRQWILSLSGGENIPPLEENTNARLIDVEGGWIYPDDAGAIRFEAKIGLRLDLSAGEAQIIVVPTGAEDENGVRIGEVRLFASGATKPAEYYVIGHDWRAE